MLSCKPLAFKQQTGDTLETAEEGYVSTRVVIEFRHTERNRCCGDLVLWLRCECINFLFLPPLPCFFSLFFFSRFLTVFCFVCAGTILCFSYFFSLVFLLPFSEGKKGTQKETIKNKKRGETIRRTKTIKKEEKTGRKRREGDKQGEHE